MSNSTTDSFTNIVAFLNLESYEWPARAHNTRRLNQHPAGGGGAVVRSRPDERAASDQVNGKSRPSFAVLAAPLRVHATSHIRRPVPAPGGGGRPALAALGHVIGAAAERRARGGLAARQPFRPVARRRVSHRMSRRGQVVALGSAGRLGSSNQRRFTARNPPVRERARAADRHVTSRAVRVTSHIPGKCGLVPASEAIGL